MLKQINSYLNKSALFKQALKDTNYYFLSQVGTKLAGLLIIPYLARVVSIEEFGYYDLFLLITNLGILLVSLGIDSGFSIVIADNKDDKALLSFLFSYTLLISLLLLIVILGVVLVLSQYFDIGPFRDDRIIYVMFLYTLFTYLNYAVFNFIRWMGRAKEASIISFLGGTLGLLIGLLFLFLSDEKNIIQFVSGMTLGNAVIVIPSIIIVRPYLNFKWVNEYHLHLAELIRISLPFVPNYLGNNFMLMADRFVILSFLDQRALGLYALCSRFAQIPSFALNIITKGFQPVMFHNYNTPEGKNLNKKVYDYTLLSFVPIMIIGSIIAKPVILLFGGPQYAESIPLVPSLVMSAIIYGSMSINGLGFIITRKTILITLITLFTIVCNFSINYLLSQQYGLSGIAFGSVTASILGAFIYTYFSERLYPFNYNLRTTILVYLLIMAGSVLSIYLLS